MLSDAELESIRRRHAASIEFAEAIGECKHVQISEMDCGTLLAEVDRLRVALANEKEAYLLYLRRVESENGRLREGVRLATEWLAERDRYFKADVPKTPASVLIRFEEKTAKAREFFRAWAEEKT